MHEGLFNQAALQAHFDTLLIHRVILTIPEKHPIQIWLSAN